MDRIKLRDKIAQAIRAGGRVSGDQHVVNIAQTLLPEFEREHNAGRAEGKAVMESKVRELLADWHKLGRGDGIHGRQLRERVLGETSPDDFHEEDEPVQDVVAAFDRGKKGVTRAEVRRREDREPDVRKDLMDAARDDAHDHHEKALEILGDL